MTYVVAADLAVEPAGIRFRALLAASGIVQRLDAHNGQATLQAKRARFKRCTPLAQRRDHGG